MTQQSSLFEQVAQAFRDHGLTAAIGVWVTFIAGDLPPETSLVLM